MINGGLFAPKNKTQYFSELRAFANVSSKSGQLSGVPNNPNQLGSILFTLS
jgi:hypothetical protein